MEEAEGERMWSILHHQDGEMLTTCAKLCRIVQRVHKRTVLPSAGGIGTAWRAPYAHLGSPPHGQTQTWSHSLLLALCKAAGT